MASWLCVAIFVGGGCETYRLSRSRDGRFRSFVNAMTWPFELGGAIARILYALLERKQ